MGIHTNRRGQAARALAVVAGLFMMRCGAADDSSLLGADGGVMVDVSLPELPASDDARYLAFLFSPKTMDRPLRFEVDAAAKVQVGPVSAQAYDVNVELRRNADRGLVAVRTVAVTVPATGGSMEVRFRDGSNAP